MPFPPEYSLEESIIISFLGKPKEQVIKKQYSIRQDWEGLTIWSPIPGMNWWNISINSQICGPPRQFNELVKMISKLRKEREP